MNYFIIIAAIITGISAIITTFSAWKLNSLSTEKIRELTLKKEKYDELKELYINSSFLFENAIKSIKASNLNEFNLEFSKINAKIRLIAPKNINDQYFLTCSTFDNWADLHVKAFPRRAEICVPDPAQKFKKPAQQEYNRLKEEITNLSELMRADLEKRI